MSEFTYRLALIIFWGVAVIKDTLYLILKDLSKANYVFNNCRSFLSQVVLAGTSTKAVAAVKDLIYTGACSLEKVAQAIDMFQKTTQR